MLVLTRERAFARPNGLFVTHGDSSSLYVAQRNFVFPRADDAQIGQMQAAHMLGRQTRQRCTAFITGKLGVSSTRWICVFTMLISSSGASGRP